jgi:hypothetical protein
MPQFLNRARGWLGRLRPHAGKPEARAGLPRDWVNIATGQRCEQSSLSDYSRPHEAHAGANGHIARDYAFHTDDEARPWWRIDLGMRYPLQAIVVHNRRAAAWQFRSRSLRIEASANGTSWFLLHQGLSYFGTGPEGRPFILELGGQVLARHVRLSLDEHRPLHLAEVEVYTSMMETALRDWLRARGLGPQGLYFGSRPDFHKPRYWFTGEGAVSAVQVREFGRLRAADRGAPRLPARLCQSHGHRPDRDRRHHPFAQGAGAARNAGPGRGFLSFVRLRRGAGARGGCGPRADRSRSYPPTARSFSAARGRAAR